MTEDEVVAIMQEMWDLGWRNITSRYEVGSLDISGKVFTPTLPLNEWSITARRYPETLQVNSVAEWEQMKQQEPHP